mgnify:CR=1 FL=1
MADRLTSSSSCARCTSDRSRGTLYRPVLAHGHQITFLRSASVLRARGARRTGPDAPPNAQSRRSVSSSLSLHSSLISILYPAHRVEHIFKGQFCQSPCFFQLQLAVRTILHSPSPPPFILFYLIPENRSYALFLHPSFAPDQALHETYVALCKCPSEGCEGIVWPRNEGTAAWCLEEWKGNDKVIAKNRCNWVGCEQGVSAKVKACARCKRVA